MFYFKFLLLLIIYLFPKVNLQCNYTSEAITPIYEAFKQFHESYALDGKDKVTKYSYNKIEPDDLNRISFKIEDENLVEYYVENSTYFGTMNGYFDYKFPVENGSIRLQVYYEKVEPKLFKFQTVANTASFTVAIDSLNDRFKVTDPKIVFDEYNRIFLNTFLVFRERMFAFKRNIDQQNGLVELYTIYSHEDNGYTASFNLYPNHLLTVIAQNISTNTKISGEYECDLHVQKFKIENDTIELEEDIVPLVNNGSVDYFWRK